MTDKVDPEEMNRRKIR